MALHGIRFTLEAPVTPVLEPTLRVHESVKFFPKQIGKGDYILFAQQSETIQPGHYGYVFTGSDLILPKSKRFTTYVGAYPPAECADPETLKADCWFSHHDIDMCFNRITNVSQTAIKYKAGQPFLRIVCSDKVPIEEVLLGNNLKAYAEVANRELEERGDRFLNDLPFAEVMVCRLDKERAADLPNMHAYVNQ